MNTESQLGENAENRQATQADIDGLGLQNLDFKDGKASLGEKTNVYYKQDLSGGYQILTK